LHNDYWRLTETSVKGTFIRLKLQQVTVTFMLLRSKNS